ncbi:regulator of chromosome condensation 1/beta-lactamase-inhibitor protein II [Baffinella frigidus]|nr:regulator of chromosome condensation 1/beta-lactamase-inhibitor protein II [Cryptophyta sp. CCMP2293]
MGANLPTADLNGAVAVAIAGGDYHTCVLLVGGSVKCWGFNANGELGLGDRIYRGRGPNEMGASTPPPAGATLFGETVNLPDVDLNGSVAVAITAAHWSNCVLLVGGSVKCWAKNNMGQLGLGDTESRGDGLNEMGANLATVDLKGAVVVAIARGNDHTCGERTLD